MLSRVLCLFRPQLTCWFRPQFTCWALKTRSSKYLLPPETALTETNIISCNHQVKILVKIRFLNCAAGKVTQSCSKMFSCVSLAPVRIHSDTFKILYSWNQSSSRILDSSHFMCERMQDTTNLKFQCMSSSVLTSLAGMQQMIQQLQFLLTFRHIQLRILYGQQLA